MKLKNFDQFTISAYLELFRQLTPQTVRYITLKIVERYVGNDMLKICGNFLQCNKNKNKKHLPVQSKQ